MFETEHEAVFFCNEPEAGLHAIIAIHSTRLGPALGGTRVFPYPNEEDALKDALLLSRAMTYKAAAADLPFGGGKAVILTDGEENDPVVRAARFRAFGRFIESLGGRYITAEDVNTSPADMDYIHDETEHVVGLMGRSGDPSPVTARGWSSCGTSSTPR